MRTKEEREKLQSECSHEYPIMYARDVSDPKRKHGVQLCSNCSAVINPS